MISEEGKHPLVRCELGNAGGYRVAEALSAGLQLGVQLSAKLKSEAGDAFTFAPPGSDSTRLLRWNEGGLLVGQVAIHHLARYLHRRLSDSSCLLILENAMARRTDPVLSSNTGRRFFIDDEVYEYVGRSATATEIEECIRRADAGYSLNGVLASVRRMPGVIEEPEYLAALKPQLLITRAYDGEGFVLWERRA